MARLFDGTDDYLVSSADLDLSGTAKATVCFWLWWDTFADDDDFAMEFTANFITNAGGFAINPNDSGTSKFSAALSNGDSATFNAEQITRPSADAWHHYGIAFQRDLIAAANIAFFLDGALEASTQSHNDDITGNFANAKLYFMSRAGTALFGAGRLAEVAIWNDALLNTEFAALGKGLSPLLVRPSNLVAYWPLIGRTSPEVELMGGNAATVTGAVLTEHPRIIYPMDVVTYMAAAGVAATVVRDVIGGMGIIPFAR